MAKRRESCGDSSSAWDAARRHGIDTSLIEANLRKTPVERIRAHARALAMAMTLREAMRRRDAGS